jgi:hypothetical protein
VAAQLLQTVQGARAPRQTQALEKAVDVPTG